MLAQVGGPVDGGDKEADGNGNTLQSWTTTSIYQKNVNIILMNAPYDGGDKGADGNGNTKEP